MGPRIARVYHDTNRNTPGASNDPISPSEILRSAHSESIKRRPVIQQLLTDASSGHFDTVVVHTLDRWSRNQRVSLEALAVLGRHHVGLVSISEDFDYSTPEGRLSFQMLGAVAQYFSDSLATHVKKGQSQRAHEGKHLGGIPFGYESCWIEENGERKRRCDPEHPGAIHLVDTEAGAVRDLFRRYATRTTTLSQLAAWLNREGFRTRNKKKLQGPDGELSEGPRLFTTASVRGILHNPFFAGKIKHNGDFLAGVHENVITEELFGNVQIIMRRNSGRSRTLAARPEREYLLKGLIRCAHCRMPMWAQTYKNGTRYYREHRESRSVSICPAAGGSIPCDVADEQVGEIVTSISLPEDWLNDALRRINLQDEVERVKGERDRVQERLRLGTAYVDGLVSDADYRRQKRYMEMELEMLVVPEANATEEAGKLLLDLPRLWAVATLEERRKLLLTVLDAVYVDPKGSRSVVEVRAKAAFRSLFEMAGIREGATRGAASTLRGADANLADPIIAR